ncbi:MAG: hypothetical protein ABIH01_05225 [Candidatus Omnitrophota bacterium]
MPNIKDINDSINRCFLRLEPQEAKKLFQDADDLSRQRDLVIYNEKNEARLISTAARPWVASLEQARFFHGICLELKEALGKLLAIYWESDAAKKIIPLSEKEKNWFHLARKRGFLSPQTIFERLDANVTFDGPNWKENFRFLETNSVGVGGIHYIPAACEINKEIFLPMLRKKIKNATFLMQPDIQDLLLDTILAHAKAIGRPRPSIVFIEDQSGPPGGTCEYEFVAAHFKEKGIKAYLADPRELYLKGDEIYFKDERVDILYRDCEIDELVQIEHSEKIPLPALKHAFVRNQVVSSFAGEFDHKSALEIFTDARFKKYFSAAQHAVFKKYIPWTRLIWERKTLGPKQRVVDLIKYIRKNKNTLVMKPNREYGGKDVTLGRFVSNAAWDKMLKRALKNPHSVVAQQLLRTPKELFPVFEKNKVKLEDFFTVSAFVVTKRKIAFLCRYSKERVVNVSRKGGLIPVHMVS